MPIDLGFLGEKLRSFRSQLQLELSELATKTGIPESRLDSFEKGVAEPTGDEILIVSDFYKCDYKIFISNEKVPVSDKIDTLYRKHGGDFSKDDRWAIQEFLFLCESEEFCSRELRKQFRTNFDFKPVGNYYKGHGKAAAESFRKWLGYQPDQVTKEDVYDDFRTTGVHLFRRKLANSNISGLFINHPNYGKCVLVNYVEDVYRQRFTVAHEFGHTILDTAEEEIIVSFTKWSKENLVEIRADSFASHFLIPSSLIQSNLRIDSNRWTRDLVVQVANKLSVNTMTLLIRLKDEGLISDREFDALKKSKIPMAEKTDPELSGDYTARIVNARKVLLESGLSTYYVRLCYEAYEKGVVSAGRLAEMLLTSDNELPNVLDLFKLKLKHEH